jgi:hypothetical protein
MTLLDPNPTVNDCLRDIARLSDKAARARDDALEEAARIADGYCTDPTDDVAAAIRALKGRR